MDEGTHTTSPLSYYTPDFLSSLCILAKSIESPIDITFTSQYSEKTKRFYDLLGEPSPYDCSFSANLKCNLDRLKNQMDKNDELIESSTFNCNISSQEKNIMDLIESTSLASNDVFLMVNGIDRPIGKVKPGVNLTLLEHSYCVNKNTWINGYFSKNANYSNTVKKHQLHAFLKANEITSNGGKDVDEKEIFSKCNGDYHQTTCPYHNFHISDDVNDDTKERKKIHLDFICECPFEGPNVNTTNSTIFIWQSMLKASTNCGKIGKERARHKLYNSSEPYLVGENYRYDFEKIMRFLERSKLELDPTLSLNLISFCLKYDTSIKKKITNGNKCGDEEEEEEEEEKLYYFVMDQPYWKIISSMKSAKNTLIPLVDKNNYCEDMLKEYNEISGKLDNWNNVASSNGVPHDVSLFLKNACSRKGDKWTDSWFSVAPVGSRRCILAVRKDVFLCLKSTWMCHYDSNLPIYDQLLKHWNLSSCYNLVDKTRKFNVLRKLLGWLEVRANKNTQFMLPPDHVDFEGVYNMVFCILDMWNTSLDEFKKALIYSHEKPKESSILKSLVSIILIKKKHVVDKSTIIKLYNWLNGLLVLNDAKKDMENRTSAKKNLPFLSHVLYILKMGNTLSDREKSMKNIIEGVSSNSLGRNTKNAEVSLFKTNDLNGIIDKSNSQNEDIDDQRTKVVKVNNYDKMNDLLDISSYGKQGFNSLKRNRNGYFKSNNTAELKKIDFSFLEYWNNNNQEREEIIKLWKTQTKKEVDYLIKDASEIDKMRKNTLYNVYFNKKIRNFQRNTELLHTLNSYVHIMDNSGCIFEYRNRKEKSEYNKKTINPIKRVEGIVKKSKIDGKNDKMGRNLSNRRKRSPKYLHQLSPKNMKRICNILKNLKPDVSNHSNKRTKLDLENNFSSSSSTSGVKENTSAFNFEVEEKNVEENGNVKIEDENEECEEWLVLGEYFAIKTLYQACACEYIPISLRKQLFLNILLVHRRDSNKKKKASQDVRYKMVCSSVSITEEEEEEEEEESLSSSISSTLESMDDSITTWEFGSIKKDSDTMKNVLVPIDFNPPCLNKTETEYIKHLKKMKEKNKEDLKEYLETLTSVNNLKFLASGESEKNKARKRGPVKRRDRNENRTEEWLWMDEVLFGNESKKLDLMKNLMMMGENENNNYGYTQMLLFAFVEYLHKVGKGKKNLGEVSKTMELAIMNYVPYFRPFQRSLSTQKVVSLDRDDDVKKKTNVTEKNQIQFNIDMDRSFLETKRSNNQNINDQDEIKLLNYVHCMESKMVKTKPNKSKLNWNHVAKVNNTYDDSFFVIFYSNSELKRWKMLSDAYIKRNVIGDAFVKDPMVKLDENNSGIILDPHIISMESFMIENVLSNIENASTYNNGEKKQCESFIEHIKKKLSNNNFIGKSMLLKTKGAETEKSNGLAIIEKGGSEDELKTVGSMDLENLDPETKDKLKSMMDNLDSMEVTYKLYPLESDHVGMNDEYNESEDVFYITRYR